MSFKDKTFCASPNCENKCGRRMTKKEESELRKQPDYVTVSFAYFCDNPSKEGE